jgi:hypothetical protein
VPLAAVHESGVDAERDVVQEHAAVDAPDVDALLGAVERSQRIERIVGVEPDVAGEVVPRPERHADEGQVALDRDRCDRCERPVSAGDP